MKEVIIDGKKYIEQDTRSINWDDIDMWSYNMEKKIRIALEAFRTPPDEFISIEEALQAEKLWVLADNQVTGVLAKSKRAKIVLSRWCEPDVRKTEPKIQMDKQGCTCVTLEFIKQATKLMEACGDYANFETAKDHPMKIENKDFCVYIAPRVDYDN